jgi:hypothetical protein
VAPPGGAWTLVDGLLTFISVVNQFIYKNSVSANVSLFIREFIYANFLPEIKIKAVTMQE